MNQSALQPELSLPTTPEDLFKILRNIEIPYSLHHHRPIFTVADGEDLKAEIPGVHCRNLFLRDKKKKMFLIVAANETAIDLKKLQPLIGADRLSFGSADRLWENLGIRQGYVSPFCVVNDTDHKVGLVLDKSMMDAEIVNYHPMDNGMTVGLSPEDLLKFFDHTGHDPQILDMGKAAPDSV